MKERQREGGRERGNEGGREKKGGREGGGERAESSVNSFKIQLDFFQNYENCVQVSWLKAFHNCSHAPAVSFISQLNSLFSVRPSLQEAEAGASRARQAVFAPSEQSENTKP